MGEGPEKSVEIKIHLALTTADVEHTPGAKAAPWIYIEHRFHLSVTIASRRANGFSIFVGFYQGERAAARATPVDAYMHELARKEKQHEEK